MGVIFGGGLLTLASCNVVLGLDDLQPRTSDSGADAGDGGPRWSQPTLLTNTNGTTVDLVVDAKNAYWISKTTSAAVFKMALTANVPTPVITGLAASTTKSLAVDDSLLYWDVGADIVAIPLAGGTSDVFLHAPGPVEAIGVDATSVFFVAAGAVRRRVGVDTTTVASPSSPIALAVDRRTFFGNVCVRDGTGTLTTFNSTGSSPISKGEPVGGPLRADGNFCYWLTPSANGFRYGDSSGAYSVEVPQAGISGLAVSANIAYTTSPTDGTVYATRGEISVPVATEQDSPTLVAANSTSVVWATNGKLMIASRLTP